MLTDLTDSELALVDAAVNGSLEANSNVFLERAVLSGAGEKGAIRLRGARVGGLPAA